MEKIEDAQFAELYNRLDAYHRNVLRIICMSFQPEDKNVWITVPEASRILGVSPQTIRSMVNKGTVPFLRPTERKTMVERNYIEKLAMRRA